MGKLLSLTTVFATLSLLAVGGGTAVLPQMDHVLVHQHGWLTDQQFRDIYSLGQVAPGPNMLMVMLIGYKLSGALGAVLVGLAFFLPSSILTFITGRLWNRLGDSPWRSAVQHGLAPVAIGLLGAGTYAVARLALYHGFPDRHLDPVAIGIALAVFGLLVWRHINPVLLIGAGGTIYLLSIIFHGMV